MIVSSSLDVDDLDRLDLEIEQLADDRLGQRLKSARHHDVRIGGVANLGDQHLGADRLVVEVGLQLQVRDRVEQLDDFLVRRVAEGAQERRREELPAAFPAIQMDVKQIARVVHDFEPGAAVGNDAIGIEFLAVGVDARLKTNAGRAVQLADHDPLGAIDDEGALRRHERKFAHVNALFLDVLVLAEAERDVKRRGESLALALAFQRAQLRLADLVIAELELDLFVVAFDGEHFRENRLQAFVLPLRLGNVLLEKILVGIELDLDQVRRFDGLGQSSEIDPLSRGLGQGDGVVRTVKFDLLAVRRCHGISAFPC